MVDQNLRRFNAGYFRKLKRHISTKILSTFIVILLLSTIFSPIISAKDSPLEDTLNKLIPDDESQVDKKTQIRNILKEFINERKEKIPFHIVTKHNGVNKTTKMKLFLPTTIDVDNDGDKDVRIWTIRLPSIDFRPPALCMKTSLIIRRLPGMDEIKNDFFEIFLEYTPKALKDTFLERIRMGVQSPEGDEMPKSTVVSHKSIPHIFYPLKKRADKVAINPGLLMGTNKLNLIFTIVNINDGALRSELNFQINHDPAIKNEVWFERSKDRVIRLGQTFEITRRNVKNSNVSIKVSNLLGKESGSFSISNIPKKITLSWSFARNGHISIDTHGLNTGQVEAKVDGALILGFTPEAGLDLNINWNLPPLRKINKGSSFNFGFDILGSLKVSDMFVNVPNNLDFTASYLSLALGASADFGNMVLCPTPGADTVKLDVTNANLVLDNCNIKLIEGEDHEEPELPTVNINSPQDGETVDIYEVVTISGNASATAGKTIDRIIVIIDGDKDNPIYAIGTTEWECEWDPTEYINGEHTIEAFCYDNEGEVNRDEINVIVAFPGNNWYPTVNIKTPTNNQIVKDVVTISGTAEDKNGDNLLVYIKINDKEVEVPVDESGGWSYDWYTSDVVSGLYTVSAQCFDGSVYSKSTSVNVWVKLKVNFDFTFSDSTIDISNFVINDEIPIMNISKIEVPSLTVSGNGYFKLTEDASIVGVTGKLNIDKTSVYVTNKTTTTTLIDELSVVLKGNADVNLAENKVTLDLDGLFLVTAKQAFDIDNITLGFTGKADTLLEFENDGKVGVSGEDDYFILNATNLEVKAGDFSVTADKLFLSGEGDISFIDDELIFQGDVVKGEIKKLKINITEDNSFTFSGEINAVLNGILTVNMSDNNFFIDYNGDESLEIFNFYFEMVFGTDIIIAKVDKVIISAEDGRAYFSYFMEDAEVVCCIDVFGVYMEGLTVLYNVSSYGPIDVVDIDGSMCFTLSSYIKIEGNGDCIEITIGGNGEAHIEAAYEFNIDDYEGSLDMQANLVSANDTFIISLCNLSGKMNVLIDGSALGNLDVFDLFLINASSKETIIDMSIDDLKVAFDMYLAGDSGHITLDIEEAGLSLDDGHIYVNIPDCLNFTLAGNIDIEMDVGTSGYLDITLNETSKVFEIDVNFDAYVDVDISNLHLEYITKTSNLLLNANQISIYGSGSLIFTSDELTVTGTGEGSGRFLLYGFKLDFEDTKTGIYLIVDLNRIDAEGSMSLNFNDADNLIMDIDADLEGSNIYISAFIKEFGSSLWTSVNIQMKTLQINGGGRLELLDKNVTFNSGQSKRFNIVIEDAIIDIQLTDVSLYLVLEEADINLDGIEVKLTLNCNGILDADFISEDAIITINTLWIMLRDIGIEIRMHNVEIYGQTTFYFDADFMTNDIIFTLHTDDTVDLGEILVDIDAFIIDLYDVSNGNNSEGSDVSIGINDIGHIVLGAKGVWDIDEFVLASKGPNDTGDFFLEDISINGEIAPTILGFDQVMSYLWFEGEAIEPTLLSFRIAGSPLIETTLEPGDFIFFADHLNNLLDNDPSLNPIGIFTYFESYGKVHLHNPLNNEVYKILEGQGHIELLLRADPLNLDPLDINSSIELNYNGEFKLFNGSILFNGSGRGYFDIEASDLDGIYFNMHIKKWIGTSYITIFNKMKCAFHKDIENKSIIVGQDPENGKTVVEFGGQRFTGGSYQTQAVQEVQVINEFGDLLINNEKTNFNEENSDDFLQGFEKQFFLWFSIAGKWIKILPIRDIDPPEIQPTVTLLARNAADKMNMYFSTLDILPGERVNFTSWYRKGGFEESPSGYYNFLFDYADGNTSTVNVDYSEDPMKIYAGTENLYNKVGTYNPTVVVLNYDGSSPPEPDEIAVDNMTINVIVERYLSVSGSNNWNHEELDELVDINGRLNGSFLVRNRAKINYSDYQLDWSLKHNVDALGDDWRFTPDSGSLQPGESEIVNFSFIPDLLQRGYKNGTVEFKDDNDPDVKQKRGVRIYYGQVSVLKGWNLVRYFERDQITTFENVFWVHSKRWEVYNWSITNVRSDKFNINDIEYSFTPDSGTYHPGDRPRSIDLTIELLNKSCSGGRLDLTVINADDEYDKTNITMYIKPRDIGQFTFISPDNHVDTNWTYEEKAYDAAPYITKAVFNEMKNGWSDKLILTLDDPTDIIGFRIRAKNEEKLDKMELIFYNDDVAIADPFIYEEWPDRNWFDDDLNETQLTVDKVEIRFHENALLTGFWIHRAYVFEFYFREAQ